VGGAGYIGSHMVKHLLRQGCDVVTFDNLSTGYREAVLGGAFVLGDLADVAALDNLIRTHHFDVVMHFASLIQVGESMIQPAKYYENNVTDTLNLLNAMVKHSGQAFHLLFHRSRVWRTPIRAHRRDPPQGPHQSIWQVKMDGGTNS
jgi:UDP-glucose 4-epimerase